MKTVGALAAVMAAACGLLAAEAVSGAEVAARRTVGIGALMAGVAAVRLRGRKGGMMDGSFGEGKEGKGGNEENEQVAQMLRTLQARM